MWRHLPLVAGVPGLRGPAASQALDGPTCHVAELIFDDVGSLQNALGSQLPREPS
jgi:hypothetical protein